MVAARCGRKPAPPTSDIAAIINIVYCLSNKREILGNWPCAARQLWLNLRLKQLSVLQPFSNGLQAAYRSMATANIVNLSQVECVFNRVRNARVFLTIWN
jgi:hypothetical protein